MCVVIETDVPLTGLFDIEREETSNSSNSYPEAESRLKDSKDEESEGFVRPSVTEESSHFCNICVELRFPIFSFGFQC